MKKEELIKSLVDKNPDLLKNSELLIKEYPEECKGLTPEELIYRTNRLKAWTTLSDEIITDADMDMSIDTIKKALPKKYQVLYKLREYWDAINTKLQNPEFAVSDKFPEALKSLQLIDDTGYLNIKTTETPKKIVGIRGECGMSVWERGKEVAKRIKHKPNPDEDIRVVNRQPINPILREKLINDAKEKYPLS